MCVCVCERERERDRQREKEICSLSKTEGIQFKRPDCDAAFNFLPGQHQNAMNYFWLSNNYRETETTGFNSLSA